MHSDLRRIAVVYLYVMPAAGLLALLILGVMIWFTRATGVAPVLAILGLVPLVAVLWLRSRLLGWYRRATWALENVPPVPRMARFRKLPHVRTGTDLVVALLDPRKPGGEPECEYLLLNPLWAAYPEQPVEAFVDPESDGPVVLRAAAGLLWPHPSRLFTVRRGA